MDGLRVAIRSVKSSHYQGALLFGLLVLAAAAISNVAQTVMRGPMFGGMSGVNYALFGYVWMKHRFQPSEGLSIPSSTVVLMIAWLFLCMTGALGPIANAAHVAGLLSGMAFGVIPLLWGRRG